MVDKNGGENGSEKKNSFKVDHEPCYCPINLKIVLLLLLVYSPAFSFMSWWT